MNYSEIFYNSIISTLISILPVALTVLISVAVLFFTIKTLYSVMFKKGFDTKGYKEWLKSQQ